MSDSQSQSHTQQLASGVSPLNCAHIHSPSDFDSTPSTRKFALRQQMKKYKEDSQQSEEEEWRYLLTKSMQNQSSFQCTPAMKQHNKALQQKKSGLTNKTAQIKNKKGCRQENMCPVCLSEIKQVRGSLDCGHQFCFECVEEWCKTSTICPCCRAPIQSILKLVKSVGNKLVKEMERVKVQPKQLIIQTEYDFYTCYQCGLGDNEHVLLICDGCDFNCCHVYCDEQLNSEIPDEDWYCIHCRQNSLLDHSQGQEDSQEGWQQDDNIHMDKGVATRTRSRESFGSHLISNLVTLRNIRRARR